MARYSARLLAAILVSGAGAAARFGRRHHGVRRRLAIRCLEGDRRRLSESRAARASAVSLAASSALARQIEASGGADIFISADLDWMDYLDKKGLIAPGSRENLLGNRLVLVAPKDAATPIAIAPHFDLLAALKGGRLAIANPDTVPAGKYGKAALTALGVWDSVVEPSRQCRGCARGAGICRARRSAPGHRL